MNDACARIAVDAAGISSCQVARCILMPTASQAVEGVWRSIPISASACDHTGLVVTSVATAQISMAGKQPKPRRNET